MEALDLQSVLRRAHLIRPCEIVDHHRVVESPIGKSEGFLGDLIGLQVPVKFAHGNDYSACRTISVVLKKSASPESPMFPLISSLKLQWRETRFYLDLRPEFCPLHLRMPRCYGAEYDEAQSTGWILMENLAPMKIASFVDGLQRGHLQCVMDFLGQFHGTWFLNEELLMKSWLPLYGAEMSFSENLYRDCWVMLNDTFVPHVALCTQLRDATSFTTRLPALSPSNGIVSRVYREYTARMDDPRAPSTLVQGDCWANNMLFEPDVDYSATSTTRGDASKVAMVDFQFVARAHPLLDVALLLAMSCAPVVRREAETTMLRVYYDALMRHGGYGWTWEECVRDYQHMRMHACLILIQSIDVFLPPMETHAEAMIARVLCVLEDCLEHAVELGKQQDQFCRAVERHATHTDSS